MFSLCDSGFDAFKAIVDQRTQKELGVARPLLQVGSLCLLLPEIFFWKLLGGL
jgi:hypothetical protein